MFSILIIFWALNFFLIYLSFSFFFLPHNVVARASMKATPSSGVSSMSTIGFLKKQGQKYSGDVNMERWISFLPPHLSNVGFKGYIKWFHRPCYIYLYASWRDSINVQDISTGGRLTLISNIHNFNSKRKVYWRILPTD